MCTHYSTEDLFSKWRNRLSQMGTEFQHVDLVLSMRAACVYSIIARDQSPLISSILQSYRSELYRILETSAKLAREAGKYQVRVNVVSSFADYPILDCRGFFFHFEEHDR